MPATPGIDFLPAGGALARWIRAGGRPTRASALHAWAYRWRGWWFDRNWATQGRLKPRASSPPNTIFVMGFWRSGTTYLHEVLTAGLQAEAPRTWQCFDPSAFLLRPPPGTGLAVQRPMDAGLISAHSPQEDEFALLARGVDSAYRFFLDPRRWHESLPTLRAEHWQSDTTPPWLQDLQLFLGWCSACAGRPLVVKSPNHIFRAAALRRHWPESRCVWIFRDPEQLWHSNLRMWRAMAGRYSLWHWGDDQIVRFVSECLRAYDDLLSHFPGGHAVVRFEDLIASPATCLQDVAARLEMCASTGTFLSPPVGPTAAAVTGIPQDIQDVLQSVRRRQDVILKNVSSP